MNWCKDLGKRCKRGEPLKRHTTFKIGGPARFFIEPRDKNQLEELLCLCNRKKLPVRILGMGSNVLVRDKGFDGAVVYLSSPEFKKIIFGSNYVIAGSGVSLARLLQGCYQKGFCGLEFLTGIPGTVGGALVMNAGIKEKCVADSLDSVTIMDRKGSIKTLDCKDARFSYRSSCLKKYVVLAGRFRVHKRPRRLIRKAMDELRTWRYENQDYSFPSAGCVFKNPVNDSAGRLIDACGLKGVKIGGAAVSLRHANFIVNRGRATAADVLALISLVKARVKRRFGVALTPEIEIWK
ncbi:MAG: UDP-N-acetylmuramate dehydrogenase [Candidatus Omnitrophota bacterium]